MKPSAKSLLPLLLLVQVAMAGNAVKFSASPQEFAGEGVIYRRLVFADNDRTVFYIPPAKWKPFLSDNQLRLTVPEKNGAEGAIESTGFDKPVPLDDNAVALLTDQVLKKLPADARNAVVTKQQLNALPFNNNPTLEVVVSYTYFGQPFQRAVVFVYTPANQIVFKFTAPKTDFDTLYRAFRSSVGTWDWQAEGGHEQTTHQ